MLKLENFNNGKVKEPSLCTDVLALYTSLREFYDQLESRREFVTYGTTGIEVIPPSIGIIPSCVVNVDILVLCTGLACSFFAPCAN